MKQSSGPKTKIFKAQYNYLCTAAVVAEMGSVAMIAGQNNLNVVEVTNKGINIQPGPGDSLLIGTHDIKFPMFKRSNPFLLSVPGPTVFPYPYLTPDIPFLAETSQMISIAGAFSRLI